MVVGWVLLDSVKRGSRGIINSLVSIGASNADKQAMGRPKVRRMIAGESRKYILKLQATWNGVEAAPNRSQS